jgi:tetratricopeptide (TPR) repeat protein
LKKKAALLAALVVLVLVEISVSWNAVLILKGKALDADPEGRVRTFRRANAVYPWNDLAYFELGKVYFEQAAEALSDPAARNALFGRAVDSFLRSLRLNPGAPAVHFHLAQTLLYMSYLSLPAPLPYFEEYKKAAELTGHNSQIYFEVGRVLLSRWETLTPEEKDFALDILKKSLAGKNEPRLLALLETWNLHVGDHALLDRILPEDAALLRVYARFLGEKSLDLAERQGALARAEQLDFLGAKRELDVALRETEFFHSAEAATHLAGSLEALSNVKFYQALTGRELIDPKEFHDVLKKARRLLAMNRIEETRSLADPDGAVAAYLDIEDEFTALGEFEGFIKERGLLGEDPTATAPAKDLQTLAFRMALDFRQNRYRDIVKVGDLLASSSLVISPSGRPSYVRILGLIGESNLKLDYVYEAEKYFRTALAIEPDNLSLLLGIEKCSNRLNDETGTAEARRAIERLVTPTEVDLGGRPLRRGETFRFPLVTDGRPRTVRIGLAPAESGGRPLASVFFDGRVVWEGYVEAGSVGFPASPRIGENTLEIAAVGGSVVLTDVIQDYPPSL